MRKLKFFAITTIVFLASCMGQDYTAVSEDAAAPYGNNALTENNVLTIAQLKEKFAAPIAASNGYEKVTDDIQIKGIVTSSDKEGNVYNEVAIQDTTGAITISLSQNSIYGYLPIGTEILVSLKDLYVGNYGMQPQIGVPSVGSKGTTSIGRMSKMVWNEHYKILATGKNIEPEVFDINKWDINKDAGKLGVIKNVTLKSGYDYNTKQNILTYANSTGGAGSVSWSLSEIDSKKLVMYNSNFADFAGTKVPTGKVNITGIFKRYNDQWEIIIRSISDVEDVTVTNSVQAMANGALKDYKGTKNNSLLSVK